MRKENNSRKPAVQRRTTNCVSDLGQVTLEGNVQTEEPLKVKKYSGACPVLGWSPGGGCPHLPCSRETVHRVSLWCLPASSAGFWSYRVFLGRTRFLASCAVVLQHCVRRFVVASNAENSSI